MRSAALSLVLLNLLCTNLTGFEYTKKAYEYINLDKIEAKYNGDGVTVGIIDTMFNVDHSGLARKSLGIIGVDFRNEKQYVSNDERNHGTHVAGIILASKAGLNEPFGVASGAKFYGAAVVGTGNYYDDIDFYTHFSGIKSIKIINNSWNENLVQDTWLPLEMASSPQEVFELLKSKKRTSELVKLSKE